MPARRWQTGCARRQSRRRECVKNNPPSWGISFGAARETLPNVCGSGYSGGLSLWFMRPALVQHVGVSASRLAAIWVASTHRTAANLIARRILLGIFTLSSCFLRAIIKIQEYKNNITPTACGVMINETIFSVHAQWRKTAEQVINKFLN